MYTKTTFIAKSNQRFTKIDINFSTLDLQMQNCIRFYLNNALILSFFFQLMSKEILILTEVFSTKLVI